MTPDTGIVPLFVTVKLNVAVSPQNTVCGFTVLLTAMLGGTAAVVVCAVGAAVVAVVVVVVVVRVVDAVVAAVITGWLVVVAVVVAPGIAPGCCNPAGLPGSTVR